MQARSRACAAAAVAAGLLLQTSLSSLNTGVFARQLTERTISTFLGAAGNDLAVGIATDGAGNFYVGGQSSSASFPIRGDHAVVCRGGATDAFWAKFSPAGELLFATCFGGSSNDGSPYLTVDQHGNVYAYGTTLSTDFPVTANAFQAQAGGGGTDAYIAWFDPDGRQTYGSYFGGSLGDSGLRSIALDGHGHVAFSGLTGSPDLPVVNGVQPIYGGGTTDAYAAVVDISSGALVYSTYLGGSGADNANSLAIDRQGSLYLAGGTTSTDFPVTVDALQSAYAGPLSGGLGLGDIFLSKIDPSRNRLVYSTYIGGSGDEFALRMALEPNGIVTLMGFTLSADMLTLNAAQPSLRGTEDAYVIRLEPTLTQPVFATYLGGGSTDRGLGGATDPGGLGLSTNGCGGVYIIGRTRSADFPVTPDAPQPLYAGGEDAFVAKLSGSGELVFATYAGGSGAEIGTSVAVDRHGRFYGVGSTTSADLPLSGAWQGPFGGGQEALIVGYERGPGRGCS